MSGIICQAVEKYAALERKISENIPSVFSRCCAECALAGKGCCRPDVGESALDTWWFRTVNSHEHGKWYNEEDRKSDICPAMGPQGCLLIAGRPLICSSFFCDKLMESTEDPWELILFAFLSDLPGWAVQISSRINYANFESADDAEPETEKLLLRLKLASELLEESLKLASSDEKAENKYSITLRLICHNPRFPRPMVRRRLLELMDSGF